jgi:hypothetical protein
MTPRARRPAPKADWQCPRCGAWFVNRNQWHSCAEASIEDWLAPLGPRGRALYATFEAAVSRCGEFRVAPAKSRIAFMGRVRFAGIKKLTDSGMTCSFSLPHALESPRFRSVREVAPGWFVHELSVAEPSELDGEFEAWLGESYRLMGMRGRLRRG